ncbi:MAG: NADH-quinone oxidoreductase subunit C [Polyangiaceae bacterium]|nr:NADH-quinone oxidoreductase subunit C [Polyangiaceae bacterium]
MSELALQKLRAKFGTAILETHSHLGDDTAVVDPAQWKAVCEFLKSDSALQFDMLADLCGVDYPDRLPRLEVVAHLVSTTRRHRLRIKTRIGDEDLESIELDSLVSVWPGANWLERETYDMFGVIFKGHPDLRRILMYPEFQGHPLRKDYAANKTQPLIAYRTEAEAGVPLDKLAPFRQDEGMSFGRNNWDHLSQKGDATNEGN